MRPLFLLIIALGMGYSTLLAHPPEKVLEFTVNETGVVFIGRDTLRADDLARYVEQRLFKSFLGTGTMQTRIKILKSSPEVPEKVYAVIIEEIGEGQHRALTQLCLEKFRKHYETLDKKQQAKLKKHYPVLFQTEY